MMTINLHSKPFISFSLVVVAFCSSNLFAKDLVLACIDCYSSMSLAPQVVKNLAPYTSVKWILIQTHPYLPKHLNALEAFPSASEKILMDPKNPGVDPLPGALSPAEVVGLLKARNVDAVCPGLDRGAYASPLITSLLGFPDNPLKSRETRIRKDLMPEIAGSYGIPTLDIRDVDETMTWLAQFPESEVILKLNSGAGGDFLKSISRQNPLELRNQIEPHLKKLKNNAGQEDKFIIQPKIVGRKFFANTFTFEGVTTLTGVGEYHMIEWNGVIMYCFDEFLDLRSAEARMLRAAVEELNPKFEVIYGAAHPEFILDERTGKLKLIEMNARVAGAGVPAIEREVYGISQLELYFLAILDPKRLKEELRMYPRRRQKLGVIFFVPGPGVGTLNAKALAQLKKHASYFIPGPEYEIRNGAQVIENTDQSTSAGVFYFVGDKNTIQSGINLATKLFDQGKLIDFRIPTSGPQECKSLLTTSKKGQITTLIQSAKNKINW